MFSLNHNVVVAARHSRSWMPRPSRTQVRPTSEARSEGGEGSIMNSDLEAWSRSETSYCAVEAMAEPRQAIVAAEARLKAELNGRELVTFVARVRRNQGVSTGIELIQMRNSARNS